MAKGCPQLAKDAGYQDLFPIDVMRAWVRIKYRYDFNDLYPGRRSGAVRSAPVSNCFAEFLQSTEEVHFSNEDF